MVDSAEEGPLSYRAMDQVTYQQRYNVAVSRAKNQVWIVHSLHKNEDLKAHGGCFDIRRSLLEYAANPKVFNKDEEISKQAESPLKWKCASIYRRMGSISYNSILRERIALILL